MVEGPLNNVTILDLSHVWAGPLGTRILADLGARVIKIEQAYARGPRQPIYVPIGGWVGGEPGDEPWNRNAIFVKLARNSSSLCIDLKSSIGRRTFLELVAIADVVIENFSARVMPSLDLDYAVLRQVNPRIIYVTMPGFGTYGPYRDRVAFGPSVEPMSGLTHVMGYSRQEPCNTAMALMDPITALTATSSIVTALRRREQTGEGAYVEQSLHEGGVSYSGHWLIDHQLGAQVQPMGNRHPQMVPHGVYRCAGNDEWVAVGCRNDLDWQNLCRIVGSDLDPAAGFDERRAIEAHIDEVLSNWCESRSRMSAVATLQGGAIPAGPVNTTPDMTTDPQVVQRGFFVPLEEFDMPVPGNPVKMRGVSSADWTRCPKLGADNRKVLGSWLGYSEEQIVELEANGIIADQPPA